MKLERSANGDSIIASAKSIDVTSEDLRKLADVVDEGDWTVRLGRSGANFRMIIY